MEDNIIQVIAQVIASRLLQALQLYQSFPHGLLFSRCDSELLPFEHTRILKDEEAIRVRKRRDILTVAGKNAANDVEKLKAMERQSVGSGVLLLRNEEFENEKGGSETGDPELDDEKGLWKDVEYPSCENGDPKSRKRKAPEKLGGSKNDEIQESGEEIEDGEIVPKETQKDMYIVNKADTTGITLDKPKNASAKEGLMILVGEMEALERNKRRQTEIFVGGLDPYAKEDDIRKVFEEFEVVVEVMLMMPNRKERNRGFAFLRYATAADAKNALAKCSNVKVCGKNCDVAPVRDNDNPKSKVMKLTPDPHRFSSRDVLSFPNHPPQRRLAFTSDSITTRKQHFSYRNYRPLSQ